MNTSFNQSPCVNQHSQSYHALLSFLKVTSKTHTYVSKRMLMFLNACSCLYKSHIRMLYIYENACIILFKTRRITFIKNSFIFIKRRCYSPVLAKEYLFFPFLFSSSRAFWTQRANSGMQGSISLCQLG